MIEDPLNIKTFTRPEVEAMVQALVEKTVVYASANTYDNSRLFLERELDKLRYASLGAVAGFKVRHDADEGKAYGFVRLSDNRAEPIPFCVALRLLEPDPRELSYDGLMRKYGVKTLEDLNVILAEYFANVKEHTFKAHG